MALLSTYCGLGPILNMLITPATHPPEHSCEYSTLKTGVCQALSCVSLVLLALAHLN